MCQRIYITTSIPYVNAQPHIGFALELVQADAIARYNRLLNKPTRFQAGTDENAFKMSCRPASRASRPGSWWIAMPGYFAN